MCFSFIQVNELTYILEQHQEVMPSIDQFQQNQGEMMRELIQNQGEMMRELIQNQGEMMRELIDIQKQILSELKHLRKKMPGHVSS